jgi:dihydrofolate reductase
MFDINSTTNLSLIVAIAQNNAIGRDNDLLWHISDDLKRFKALTSGHTVIMGRNTWNSLPRRPLPKRRNIVLTHDTVFCDEGAEVAHSISQVIDMVRDEDEAFIIGGAAIYRQFLPFVSRMYVTWVWQDFHADVFFPVIDLSVFNKINESERYLDDESGLTYSYCEYERRPVDNKSVFKAKM